MDGLTSLREAVIQANDHDGFDTITFAAALANLPVLLQNGQLTITETLTIQGLGATKTTIDGQNGTARLFDITDTAATSPSAVSRD